MRMPYRVTMRATTSPFRQWSMAGAVCAGVDGVSGGASRNDGVRPVESRMTVGVVGIGEQRRLAQLHLGGGHVAEWRARTAGRCDRTRARCPNEGVMAVSQPRLRSTWADRESAGGSCGDRISRWRVRMGASPKVRCTHGDTAGDGAVSVIGESWQSPVRKDMSCPTLG